MDQLAQAARLIRFGVFELDLRTGELRKSGLKLRLQGQPVEVLKMLLERPGELVTREELEKRLWVGDTVVEFEHSINAAVDRLREALGDSADNPRYVETLARRGYRFIFPVAAIPTGRDRSSSSPIGGEDAAATTPSAPVAPVEGLTPGPSPQGRGEQGHRMSGASPQGREEQELVSVPQPSPAGERVSRPVGTGEGALGRRRWIIIATGGALVIIMLLLALNVAGLRDRLMAFVGAGSARPREDEVGARHGVPLPNIQSIAVLPLENLSGDKEQEYFADGMTEELITSLGKIGSLRVISRTSVMQFKGARPAGGLAEIAQKLNVDAIVEGSVMRSGDRVRITANLLDARSDRHLWAEAYERDVRDILGLQGEVAQAIAHEVQVKLTPQEQTRLARAHPVNPEAHELYLKGSDSQGRGDLKKALEYFQLAIDKDPKFARAYFGLAWGYGLLGDADELPGICVRKGESIRVPSPGIG